MKKLTAFLIIILILLGCLSGCGRRSEVPELYYTSPEQLNVSKCSVGVGTGTAAEADTIEFFDKAKICEYTVSDDGYLAVQSGLLDGYVFTRANMEYALANSNLKGLTLLDENIGDGVDVVVGISRKTQIPDLTGKVNNFIDQILSDGTFDDSYRRWVVEGSDVMPDIPVPENPSLKVTVGTTGLVTPFSYYKGDILTGMDLELIYRFSAYLNAELEIKVYDYMSIVAASETGDIDCVFANFNATPERAEVMDFSKPLYTMDSAVMVRCPVQPSLSDYAGKKIGVLTGSIHDSAVKEHVPSAVPTYFSNVSDQVAALLSGTIDAFSIDVLTARALMAENEKITYLDSAMGYISTAFAFSKDDNGSKLASELSEFLEELDADGTLAALEDKWLETGAGDYDTDFSGLDQYGRSLTFATSCSGKPNAYYLNGKPTGYEVELAAMFCREYGYNLDIQVTDFSGLLPGLKTGRYDFAADGIAVTEERTQSVNFSVPDYNASIVLVIRSGDAVNKESFFQSVASSFERNFLREDRWKLIVRGIGTTVYISLFASIFGTILGFGICMLRRLLNPVIHAVTTVYIRILQGTPLVVLLMVLYYLVFPHTKLNGEWVSIVAFSLNFAAYVSEMMRTGIESVDVGQTEAALALGFTRSRAFFKFILPQAARNFLPVYKGEFISLVKMTSIVGYIAVQDLTKMSDIIRSRTYEAFFPLISTAVIYFIISALLSYALHRLEKKTEPDRRNRTVKGVKMQ